MSDAGESLITPELQESIGRETAPGEVTVSGELVRRVLETVEEQDERWYGDVAPPYVLMAFEMPMPSPPVPAAPATLVTGDEWTLHRPLRVGERLAMTGRLASAHERFGSRFGHTLALRGLWTFVDAGGAVVAEVGRSMIHYRPPEQRFEVGGVTFEVEPAGAEAEAQPHTSHLTPHTFHEGEPLPPAVVRPSLTQVVRYCGLTWNFVPIFYDPEAALRAGLPGTIVPGPLKLALLTRYLAALTGPNGFVRAVRCAHRRPDRTGHPLTLRGAVSQITDEDGFRRAACEVWTENAGGERSVIGSATVALTPRPPGRFAPAPRGERGSTSR